MTIPQRALIGILGGMGPAATIDFMTKIMKATSATNDQEHVPLIIHNVPQIPDRSSAIRNNSDEPWLPLLAGVRMLERAGVDVIAIPCNAAHYWHERLTRITHVEIMHIADAANWSIKTRPAPISRLAIMATRGTILGEIYSKRLSNVVGELMVPKTSIQDLIDQSIAAVKGGGLDLAAELAEKAACRLLDTGADALLLACSELPIALKRSAFYERSIDPTDALARRCVFAAINPRLGPPAVLPTTA
jgi:aspartate racemase